MSSSTRRKLLFAALYFSEGAPIGFLWWALPTRLTTANVPLREVTALTSLLVLPWTFKFLWAPLIDALQFSRWTLRHWITVFQLLMAVTLIPLFFLDLQADFQRLAICLFLHACFAASQDVAIDALCISLTRPEERGTYNAWMQAGMLAGRSLLGGGALILFSRFGHQTVVSSLLVAILLPGVLLWLLREGTPRPAERSHDTVQSAWREVLLSLKLSFSERSSWWMLLFALTAAAAFEALGAVQGPFLRKADMTEEAIGWLMAVPYVIALTAGSILGGVLADRIGLKKIVCVSLLGFVGCVAVAGLAMSTENSNTDAISRMIITNGFFVGMFTASSYALFMNLTHPSVAGTQFSAMMGAANGCEAWSTRAIGTLSSRFGLPLGLWTLAGVSIASLICLIKLHPMGTSQEDAEDGLIR